MKTARSQTYTARAVVLRTYSLGEADRIIVLATADRGIVRAVAPGVRKTASKFGSRLEPFMLSDLQLAEGRSLHRVLQAVTAAPYGLRIVQDYEAYTYASAIAELAEMLTEDADARGGFDLLVGALAALARQAYPPQLIFDAFAIRSLCLAGWDMAVDACAVTGSTERLTSFSPSHGGVVSAESLRIPGAAVLRPGVQPLLSSLKSGDWTRALASDDSARRQAHELTRAFLGWHLERTLSSLPRRER